MTNSERTTCPCCGFLVLEEPPGGYAACEYCGWKDDALHLANPCGIGGVNHPSLDGAQEAFQNTTPKAGIDEWIDNGAERDTSWCFLNNVEKKLYKAESKKHGLWHRSAMANIRNAYWNRNMLIDPA